MGKKSYKKYAQSCLGAFSTPHWAFHLTALRLVHDVSITVVAHQLIVQGANDFVHGSVDLKAEKLDNTMSFMFETRFPQHLTEFAAKEAPLQDNYIDCWKSLEKKFDGTPGKK